MEYKVKKIEDKLIGGTKENPKLRKQYKIERIDVMKDADGKDVRVPVHVRDITKEGAQAKINRLTTQIAQLQEEKVAMEEMLIEIENKEKEE